MSARLILHIILTLVLFSVGGWLYMSIGNVGALSSVGVATYWFVVLVYVLLSWIFYWIVHRLRLRYWIIMQILAIVLAAIATASLLYVSREYQQKIEEDAIEELNGEEALGSDGEQNSAVVTE